MLTRRTFVGSTLGAGAALATGARPALPQAGKTREIVDSQVHLWKAESEDWKWVPGAKPQLPEPFTIERALPLMDEAGVSRVVIVPPSWIGDRNDYALEAVNRYPNRFAIMGRFPVQDPKAAPLLAKWKEQPGMLGVRVTFNSPKTVEWLKDGTADWFWSAAEKAGLPVMYLAAMQGAQFARIAERHPQLPLVVDHMGVVTAIVRAGRIGEAIEDTLALAKFPNVSVELSATPLMSSEPYPYRDMTVHIRSLFDAYGPRRCYWGTDITNSLNKATYRQRITHFTETLDFMSEEDKDWVMGRAIRERLKWM